ncbi:MAG: signal peptidase I [Propionibacteriaceae bacterium]|jgi:signal peptidase I|nr:signal peptidase I [Propionibacteriaceae bacterium]
MSGGASRAWPEQPDEPIESGPRRSAGLADSDPTAPVEEPERVDQTADSSALDSAGLASWTSPDPSDPAEEPERVDGADRSSGTDQLDRSDRLDADESPDRADPVSRAQPRRRNPVSVVCDVVLVLFCVVLVVAAGIYGLNSDQKGSILGFRFLNVLTGSMAPGPGRPPGGFSAGDLLVVRESDPASIQVGDIVTFQVGPEGPLLSHRVTQVLSELDGHPGLWFVTRGDANPSDDPVVGADRVVGRKFFTLPKVGGFLARTRENSLAAGVFAVSALGFVLALRHFFREQGRKVPVERGSRALV